MEKIMNYKTKSNMKYGNKEFGELHFSEVLKASVILPICGGFFFTSGDIYSKCFGFCH